MMGFGFLAMVLFWGVVVALTAGGGMLVFKDVRNSQTQSSGSDLTARQVLDGRLARGEISVDEFERIRARLDD